MPRVLMLRLVGMTVKVADLDVIVRTISDFVVDAYDD